MSADNEQPRTIARNSPVPFFEKQSAAAGRTRLLLISYHFPPGQSVGSLRWQKLSQLASERGWEMDVVTVHPSSLRATDPSRLPELAPGTRVFGVPMPKSLAERFDEWLLSFLRSLQAKRESSARRQAGTRGIPAKPSGAARPVAASSLGAAEIRWNWRDKRTLIRAYHAFVRKSRWHAWARAAEAVAMSIAKEGVHRAVISCGPPHEAHVAATRVSTATGLPFVLDLRDPWSQVERLPETIASPVWLRASENEERRAMARASIVACNTEPSRRALASAYPNSRARIITVMNGYDEEPLPASRASARFTIAYAGSIYLDRDPRLLFRAAKRVITNLELTPADIGFVFIGNVEVFEGVRVSRIARDEGIEAFVSVGPSLPRPAMLDFLAGAAMLVSLPQDSNLAIPSKVFEYMQFDAWLLALADKDSATELLLRESDADVVAPDDVDGMAEVLRSRYREYASGIRPERLSRHRQFSRREQARILFDAIENVIRDAHDEHRHVGSVPQAV